MDNIPHFLGKTFAYIQDTVDVFYQWVFFRIKKYGSVQTTGKPQPAVQSIVSKILQFIARVGESFYEEYEKLKKRH